MLIAGVLCLCAAVLTAALGLWTLSRPRRPDVADRVRRAVAPTQLAAALMLAAGGVVAVSGARHTGLVVLLVCVIGAFGTVAVGSWQGARYAVNHAESADAGCEGSCAACTLSCQSAPSR